MNIHSPIFKHSATQKTTIRKAWWLARGRELESRIAQTLKTHTFQLLSPQAPHRLLSHTASLQLYLAGLWETLPSTHQKPPRFLSLLVGSDIESHDRGSFWKVFLLAALKAHVTSICRGDCPVEYMLWLQVLQQAVWKTVWEVELGSHSPEVTLCFLLGDCHAREAVLKQR